MVGPQCQGGADLALVNTSIVDTRDTTPMAAVMVECRFDHMRLHSNVAHAGCYGSANVVQPPRLHGCPQTQIKLLFAAAKVRKSGVSAIAEQLVPVASPRHRFDDCQCCRWQNDPV